MDFNQYVNQEKENNRPVCFFTVNDLVREDKLEQKLKSLSQCGYGGIYFHARSGLIGSYLSDEWFSLVEKAIDFCDKYKLEFWVYDEFGWPSGTAGGLILKNNPSFKQKRLFKNDNPLVVKGKPIAYYDKSDNPTGREKAFYSLEEVYADGYVDLLNEEVTDEFINVTYEQYKRRFGGRIKGFFTDEPQFGMWLPAWNDKIEKEIAAKYGDKAFSYLPALFTENKDKENEYKLFREFYFGLCSSLFIDNYIGRIAKWCGENNYLLTGHILEEKELSYELRSCADVFDVYAVMQCPGIDWLGAEIGNAVAPKQMTSVFRRYKKSRCVSETGATMGYGRSLSEIANIFEWQVALGVTNICGIIPYSLRGRRKRDYPSGIISEQPYFEKLSGFNDRLSRLCAVAALEEVVDVLLIQPLKGARESYVYGIPSKKTEYYDELYENAVETLTKNNCLFHIASIGEVERGTITDGELQIGNCRYKTVIALDDNCLASCREKKLAENGVNVIACAAEAPSHIVADDELFITVHKYGDDYVLIAKNTCAKAVSGEIVYNGKLPVGEFDLNDGKSYGFKKGNIPPKQTAVYIYGKNVPAANREEYAVVKVDENDFKYRPLRKNSLILDFVAYTLDGGVSGRLPVIKLFEKLIAEEYVGKLTMTYEFENRGYDGSVSVAVEDSRKFEVFLNGEKLDFSNDESGSRALVDGINRVTLKADYFQKGQTCKIWKGEVGEESDFNMLGDMFELENVCINGDFGVYFDDAEKLGDVYSCDKPYLARQKSGGKSDELILNGFPFYSGALEMEKEIDFSNGENSVFPIIPNGCAKVGDEIVYFDKPVKVTEKDGKKKLVITLYNTLRNYLGPDHNIYGECRSVGFTTFSSVPGWCDPQGKDMWTDRYMLIPFGVKFGRDKE